MIAQTLLNVTLYVHCLFCYSQVGIAYSNHCASGFSDNVYFYSAGFTALTYNIVSEWDLRLWQYVGKDSSLLVFHVISFGNYLLINRRHELWQKLGWNCKSYSYFSPTVSLFFFFFLGMCAWVFVHVCVCVCVWKIKQRLCEMF
jgi:hypothetical protein